MLYHIWYNIFMKMLQKNWRTYTLIPPQGIRMDKVNRECFLNGWKFVSFVNFIKMENWLMKSAKNVTLIYVFRESTTVTIIFIKQMKRFIVFISLNLIINPHIYVSNMIHHAFKFWMLKSWVHSVSYMIHKLKLLDF